MGSTAIEDDLVRDWIVVQSVVGPVLRDLPLGLELLPWVRACGESPQVGEIDSVIAASSKASEEDELVSIGLD